MSGDRQIDPQQTLGEVLTRIHETYTLPHTPENDIDEIMVKNFFQTLAEVALAVAARENKQL